MSLIMKGKCITGNVVECIETGELFISIKSAASFLDVPEHVLVQSVASGIGILGLHYKIHSREESKELFNTLSRDSFIHVDSEKKTHTTRSYVFMNKEGVVTRVPPDRIQDYIDSGWKMGRVPLSEEQRAKRRELYKSKIIHKSGVKVMCVETGNVYNSKALASKETGVSVYKIEMSLERGTSYNGYTFRRAE